MQSIPDFEAAVPEALEAYGRRLGAQLPTHALLVLVGDLGAGKTTLTKGLAEGLGVASAGEVTSPTYTLVHEYHSPERSLYHVDLYRVESASQFETLGLRDILSSGPETPVVIAIEWGERIEATLPRPYLRVSLFAPDPALRRVHAEWILE